MNKELKKLIISAILLAIGIVLSWITFIIGGRELSTIISPLHIPVFIAGLIMGWKYGLLVGFVMPLLSSLVRGMPQFYPSAIGMAFELGTYGFVAGLMTTVFKNIKHEGLKYVVCLACAMLAGRLMYGLFYSIFYGITHQAWTFTMFITLEFVKQIPAILIHITLIPLIVMAIKRTGRFNFS